MQIDQPVFRSVQQALSFSFLMETLPVSQKSQMSAIYIQGGNNGRGDDSPVVSSITFGGLNASAFSISNDVYVSISGTLSIAALVPKNAFSIFGSMQMASLGSTTNYGFSFIGVNSVGMSGYDNYSASAYSDLILAAPQSLSYGVGVGSSPVNVTLNISGYKF